MSASSEDTRLRSCRRCRHRFYAHGKEQVCPDCLAPRRERVRDTLDVFDANARRFGRAP